MSTILLIDDDPGFVRIMKQMLEGNGHTLYCAEHEEQGRKMLGDHGDEIDVALVDFWLNGRSAIQIFDHIREEFPKMPVIAISGGGGSLTLEVTKAVGEVSGAVHFLPKPFRHKELLELVGRVVHGDLKFDS